MKRISSEEERGLIDNEHILDTGHVAGIDPHKYQVTDDRGRTLDENEFFLLRRGDALATATLRSYAANAMTLLDLADIGIIGLPESTRRHLVALADDVSDLAVKWENDGDLKLPD